MLDTENNREYYWNRLTGLRSWERYYHNLRSVITMPPVTIMPIALHHGTPLRPFARPKMPTATLPPNWRAIEDEVTGMAYFWNEATGVTSWEFPES